MQGIRQIIYFNQFTRNSRALGLEGSVSQSSVRKTENSLILFITDLIHSSTYSFSSILFHIINYISYNKYISLFLQEGEKAL